MSCQSGAYFAKMFHRSAMAARSSRQPKSMVATAAATQQQSSSSSISTSAATATATNEQPPAETEEQRRQREREEMYEVYDKLHEGWEDWFFHFHP